MQPVLRLMDERDVARVHEGALQILDRVGVRFGSPHAEALLQEAGQRCDPQTRAVRLAPDLVERCLAQLPSQVLLAARDPKRDARERAGSLLSRHEVLPLPGDVAKALDEIVKRAERTTGAGERHG